MSKYFDILEILLELSKVKLLNHIMQIKNTQIKFNSIDITAVIDVNKKELDIESRLYLAEKYNLLNKTDFHFTIIWSATGKEIIKLISNLSEKEKKGMINKIERLCESTSCIIELKSEFYYLAKYYYKEWLPDEKRESIIQIASIKELDKFYSELNNILNTKFELPIPHLTLFTNSTREDKKLRWIWIYSESQFVSLNPEKIFINKMEISIKTGFEIFDCNAGISSEVWRKNNYIYKVTTRNSIARLSNDYKMLKEILGELWYADKLQESEIFECINPDWKNAACVKQKIINWKTIASIGKKDFEIYLKNNPKEIIFLKKMVELFHIRVKSNELYPDLVWNPEDQSIRNSINLVIEKKRWIIICDVGLSPAEDTLKKFWKKFYKSDNVTYYKEKVSIYRQSR